MTDIATPEGVPGTLRELLHPIADLQPFPGNPRRGNVDLIVDSLRRHGQYRPVVANRRTMQVLAGNHTLAAARVLGWEQLAVTWVDVDDEQAARIVLVDNRASDLAGYDEQALADILSGLPDLDATGFLEADLDALLASLEPKGGHTDPDDVPDLPATPRSKPGDLWLLGPHRLVCGNSTQADTFTRVMGGVLADAVWTDPPYGVEYVGKTKAALTIQNDGAAGLSKLLLEAFAAMTAVCRPGAPVYIAHADTERVAFEGAARAAGLVIRQNLIWVKSVIVMGRSDYHYKHEPILAAELEDDGLEDEPEGVTHEPVLYGFTPPERGQGRLGRGGPWWFGDNRQSTVFEVPKPKRNAQHPTMKPVELIVRMLTNSCRPGGVVLDPFGGSGSTLIAAHRVGAKARLIELDPRYCDVICRRYQEHTGVVPVLDGTGEVSFTEEVSR